ncbi:MAG: 2-hydroxyacid dehydrogenase [Thermodesulfobacteriota bacterium]
MAIHGICLRPARDFENAGVKIPESLSIDFFVPESKQQVISAGRQAEFVISPSHSITMDEDFFAGLPNLKIVQLTGAGYDRVDLKAAARHDVPVAHGPGQNSRSVAQYVFIKIGMLSRRVLEADRMVKENKFSEARRNLSTLTLHEFGGQNLGIIGIGRIGQEVAEIAKFFGYNIGYYDIQRLNPDREIELGVRYYPFESILGWADIISLHVPLTKATRGLIGANELQAMKPGAIIINIARGGIVDEEALCRALENETIRGAAMDVFSIEPPPASHPYLKLDRKISDRLLLSPHMGGRTQEANRRMFSFALENVRAFLADGKPLQCVIGTGNTTQED